MATRTTNSTARKTPGDWGSTQKLPSGRYRAFYRYGDQRISAPHTFETKDQATGWLALARGAHLRGTWIDPRGGRRANRSRSRPRSSLRRQHIVAAQRKRYESGDTRYNGSNHGFAFSESISDPLSPANLVVTVDPDHARDRALHTLHLAAAREAKSTADARREFEARNTCPVCGEVFATDANALQVKGRSHPLLSPQQARAGSGDFYSCGLCFQVMILVLREELGEIPTTNGRTRRQSITQWVRGQSA